MNKNSTSLTLYLRLFFGLVNLICLLLCQTSVFAVERVPALTLLKTTSGRTHVGEVIENSSARTVLFDLQLKDTIIVNKTDIESTSDNISETSTINAVGYPVFAAWKLSRIIKAGKVQGKLTLSTDKKLFATLGSGDGIAQGQKLTLLGDAEDITDPETGETLGVVRDHLGTLSVKDVKNRRFSEVSPLQIDPALKFESGMLVECERESKSVVLLKPEWNSDKPNLQTGDEAALLAEHILTELVEFGVPVFSQDEVQDQAKQIAQKTGVTVDAVSSSKTARKLGASLLVTGKILPRSSRLAEVSLRVTDVAEGKYLGIISGRIRRDRVKQDFQSAQKSFKAKMSAMMDLNQNQQMLVNSIGMWFRNITPGSFTMGSVVGINKDGREKPAHKVTLTKPFQIGIYEVTQAQYQRVMGVNPSQFKNPRNPVENICWNDAVEFCRKLSEMPEEKAGRFVYRLPTEAEWEYTCRAGTTTRYNFGNAPSQLANYAWFLASSSKSTHPVGTKRPNRWGLYDMHGNVSELCQDWFAEYPNEEVIDQVGPEAGTYRNLRGGSWLHIADYCCSAFRNKTKPDYHANFIGFRVVREQINKN